MAEQININDSIRDEEYETLLKERDFIKEAVGKGRVIYENA
jgi:hypothetical protein